MIDWNSPAVLAKTASIFNNFSHWAIGAYVLEWALSLRFEFEVITGRRPFKIPMILYVYTKWSVLTAFVGMVVSFNINSEINCQALYSVNQYFGNTGIAAASTLLMLRTFAIWNQKKLVVYPLVCLALAQWGIALWGVTTVKASFNPVANACVVEAVKNSDLGVVYLSTMFVDCVVLVLTLIGLISTPGRSNLWRMLMKDGLVFFAVAFLANTLPAVLLLIDLNPVMNIMFSIPAVGASAAVACRSFVRLAAYANPGTHSSRTATNGWTHTRTNTRGGNTKVGVVSVGTWQRTPGKQDDFGGVSVTQTQHVDVEMGMQTIPQNMHPLQDYSDEHLDRKGYAV